MHRFAAQVFKNAVAQEINQITNGNDFDGDFMQIKKLAEGVRTKKMFQEVGPPLLPLTYIHVRTYISVLSWTQWRE